MSHYKQEMSKGFTLLEVMLSLAIIGLLGGLTAPVYQAFQSRSSIDLTAAAVAQSMRRAQVLSQAVAEDDSWGVSIQSTSVTLFKGPSFAARAAGFDEVFDITGSTTVSGLTEVVFTQLTGEPQTTGTTTLTSSSGATGNIVLHEKGTITY